MLGLPKTEPFTNGRSRVQRTADLALVIEYRSNASHRQGAAVDINDHGVVVVSSSSVTTNTARWKVLICPPVRKVKIAGSVPINCTVEPLVTNQLIGPVIAPLAMLKVCVPALTKFMFAKLVAPFGGLIECSAVEIILPERLMVGCPCAAGQGQRSACKSKSPKIFKTGCYYSTVGLHRYRCLGR